MTDATSEARASTRPRDAGNGGPAPISAAEWLRQFSRELGLPVPAQEEIDALLGLAGIAAHASERTAAPLSTWLVGRAGVEPSAAKELAARLAGNLSPQGEE